MLFPKRLAALAFAMLASCSKDAAPPVQLAAGQTVEGRLESADSVDPQTRRPVDRYTFEATAGQLFDVTVQPDSAHIAWADVVGPDGSGFADEGGTVHVAATATGQYRVRVGFRDAPGSGPYRISLTAVEAASASAPPGPLIALGQALEGVLEEGDSVGVHPEPCALDAGDCTGRLGFEDRLTIEVTPGRRYELKASVPITGRAGWPPVVANATGEPYGCATPGMVIFRPVESARPTFWVYEREQRRRPYRVTLRELTTALPDAGATTAIDVGATKEGVLELGDRVDTVDLTDEYLTDVFAVTPSQSGAVSIEASSTQFAPVILVRDDAGNTVTEANERNPGSTRATVTLEAGHTYEILVRSWLVCGTYRLSVAAGAPPQ